MSKWNKPAKPLTQQFLQNEERRRQMIIEAAKLRREKEKKLQQINENLKRNEQQALEKRKKEQQQAYNKYFKGNNMHDKYQQVKRNEKMKEEPKRDVSKWKRRQKSQTKTIQGLDLEISHGKINKNPSQNKAVPKQIPKKGLQTKKAVASQFQKQWGEQSEENIQQRMIGSQLIDSLDLDIDTIQRGRELNYRLEEVAGKKNNKENMRHEKNDLQEIKNLIGYDSMLVSNDNITNLASNQNKIKQLKVQIKKQEKQKKNNSKEKVQQKKQVNEQETFNNLKHKKQAKILEWANQESQEADDLFSNYSSKKNSILTKQSAAQNRGSKKQLQPIPQKFPSSNKSIEKERKPNLPPANAAIAKKVNPVNKSVGSIQKTANDSKNKIERIQSAQKISQPRVPRINPIHDNNRNRSTSKERLTQPPQNAFQKQKQRSLQKLRERKFSGERASGSADKMKKVQQPRQPERAPKTQQPFRINKNPPIPLIPKPAYTVATHEQDFNVESFIKNDLLELNEEERKLQQEIRNIHVQNKEKVKEIYNKYEIRTNYKTSANLIKHHERDPEYGQISQVINQNRYATQHHMNQNEDLIEDSVQRLDDLLIKQQINSRERTQAPSESNVKSIINPLSKPEDLHKQILQLAENISKFEQQPDENVKGYGYQRKMKKKEGNKQYIQQQILSESKNIEDVKKPQEINRNLMKMPHPPILQYSGKDNEIIEVNLEQKYFDPEDSLQTMEKQKIKVNQKLRNILFDD